MTTLAAPSSPASTLLADLNPDSGLALRRWTPDEFRRLASSSVLSDAVKLDLADGEIVDCGSRAPYLFNRDEYYSLAEQGILGPDERTELIYGRIITRMSPIGQPHNIAVSKTANALERAFGDAFFTEQQMSLHVASGSEPQPDVMVLAGVPDNYADAPRPADVLLLVAVSNTTLHYDRSTKSTLYAENGIADYWIVNLRSRTLEVYRQPEGDAYVSLRVYDETEAVAPLAAPNAAVRVADLLPIMRG
jgi:Uma2 family endonuclease